MQCGELDAALRQQQQAYAELEGQLSGSRQKGKELQARFHIDRRLALASAHLRRALPSGCYWHLLAQALPHTHLSSRHNALSCNLAESRECQRAKRKHKMYVFTARTHRSDGVKICEQELHSIEEGQGQLSCEAKAAPCGAGAAADEPGGAQALGGAAARCAAGAPGAETSCPRCVRPVTAAALRAYQHSERAVRCLALPLMAVAMRERRYSQQTPRAELPDQAGTAALPWRLTLNRRSRRAPLLCAPPARRE